MAEFIRSFGGVSNTIALGSLIISIGALVVTIFYNVKLNKQYIASLSPLLSFKFKEQEGILYLEITNTGQSDAKNIRLVIKEMFNNGDRNELDLDDLFNNEFVLFPNETVQGKIGFLGENLMQKVFPVVNVDISYIKGNDSGTENYSRTITFTRTPENSIDLKNLEENLNSIAYSNNRTANYLEGRTLFVFDKLNVLPNNSLYKDMKDAFNNIERNKKTNEDDDN